MTTIGSSTPTYDANGNVTNNFLHTYAWDAEGRPVTIDGVGMTYDALGRAVELNNSGVHTETQYSPTGFKMQLLNGQTLVKDFLPLPGGTAEVWTPSANYYRHADWLGSARLTSNQNRTIYGDVAYAPFGETYAQSGTADASFTGMNQDTVSNEYDFPAREYGIQGRWPSPDPAGLGAVNLGDPQTWNRYAYLGNNPLAVTDPSGMGPELGGICATNPIACAIASVLEGLFFFFGHHHHHATPPPHAAPAPQGGYGAGIDAYGTWDESLPAGVQVFPQMGFPGIPGVNPGGSGCTYGSGDCGGMIYGIVNISGGGAQVLETPSGFIFAVTVYALLAGRTPTVAAPPPFSPKPKSWHNFVHEFLPCYRNELISNFFGDEGLDSDGKIGATVLANLMILSGNPVGIVLGGAYDLQGAVRAGITCSQR